MEDPKELRERAAWYRETADRLGTPSIRELHLRKAARLEETADAFETRQAREQGSESPEPERRRGSDREGSSHQEAPLLEHEVRERGSNEDFSRSGRIETSVEEVFTDDPEFMSDVARLREASREAARFIKKLRLAAGLTQRQLAGRLDISQPRVSSMERGAGPEGPTYAMLKRVAAACGIQWSLEGGLGRLIPKSGGLSLRLRAMWKRSTRPRSLKSMCKV